MVVMPSAKIADMLKELRTGFIYHEKDWIVATAIFTEMAMLQMPAEKRAKFRRAIRSIARSLAKEETS